MKFVWGLVAFGLGILAAALQVFAIALLVEAVPSQRPLLSFCVAQALAALASALFVVCCSPAAMRRPLWKGVLFGFVFSFFLPMSGQLILCSVLLARWLWPHREREVDMEVIGLPSFESRLLDRVRPADSARVRIQAADHRIGVEQRMVAMGAIRRMPPHVTGGLLNDLLSDSQDEIRLLSYGVMEQAESRIMQDISRLKDQLDLHNGTRREAVVHARLAELNWELVYQQLVHGEVRSYALSQAAEHAGNALKLRPGLAGMHYLLGHCALQRGAPAEACEEFEQAQELGMTQARVAPWMGEALFQDGQFSEVPGWMRRTHLLSANSALQSVARFWQ